MENIIFYVGLCLILSLLLLCFYLESRARRIIISMMFGVIAAIVSYLINKLLISFDFMDNDNYSFTIGPLIEEIAKFIPIIIISSIVKKGKRGSSANAFSVGVGFGVCENLYYLFSCSQTATIFWVILRCLGTCLMHCMSATIMGLAIYNARIKNKFKPLLIIGGLLFAILIHCTYNNFVSNNILKYIGIFIPLILFILFFFILKKQNIHDFLWDKDKE